VREREHTGLGLEGPKMLFESELGQSGRKASIDVSDALNASILDGSRFWRPYNVAGYNAEYGALARYGPRRLGRMRYP